jgi:hypothetical protein
MDTEHRSARLAYAAGYLATRKARLEQIAGMVTISAWNHNPALAQQFIADFGGGISVRGKYTVWTLSGPQAEAFLAELLPISEGFPGDLPQAIRAALEKAG